MVECLDGSCAVVVQTRDEKRKSFKHDESSAADIYQGLRDDLFRIGQNYFVFNFDLARIEGDLHDAWDELIHAAKRLPLDGAEHDRLVTLILELRELGQLQRKKKDTDLEEVAVMPNGERLWIDLPYLAEELYASWMRESTSLTRHERQSLAVFSGKLCAVGVCVPELAQSALWLLKEALETDRPETGPSTGSRALVRASPTIADLLPACLAWLKFGNGKLAKLSLENYRPTTVQVDVSSHSPGSLATGSGIESEGFSLARWLFWRQRLGDLYRHGCDEVAKLARACFEEMIYAGLAMSIDIPGEKRYLAKLFEALDKELASKPKWSCLGAEDIEIDPTWAIEDHGGGAA
ncbi:hypothetical protein LMH87_005160 [Akanthomyces muscarius]|uniref:Uncharacterized protein n=1 Tax=Akanthomyces muscarius TaxID=2231603 RepID=A0A9W8QN65_AKAMU|nr:hypothetical protein LMH87_005160 [Akanthomyces muscarius]KAJ4163429.1 hypothetical protein LMH87_005160 [Akanthomyces muscarius]